MFDMLMEQAGREGGREGMEQEAGRQAGRCGVYNYNVRRV